MISRIVFFILFDLLLIMFWCVLVLDWGLSGDKNFVFKNIVAIIGLSLLSLYVGKLLFFRKKESEDRRIIGQNIIFGNKNRIDKFFSIFFLIIISAIILVILKISVLDTGALF